MRKAFVLTSILCAVFALGCLPAPGAPVADGSLFSDDFSSGDLGNWKRVDGTLPPTYDGAVGNPPGSIHVDTNDGNDDGFARPNAFWANSGQTEWVVEFDVRVNDSTGGEFLISESYSPDFAAEVDIGVVVGQNDWVVDWYGTGAHAWDYRVRDAAGTAQIQARLRASDWHHFNIYRKSNGEVDLTVNGAPVGTYQARNPSEIWGELQIGDTSTGPGVGWGDVHWDNFYIGEPLPSPPLTAITVSNAVMLEFDSADGIDYGVEFVENLGDTNWMSAGLVITGDGSSRFAFDPAGIETSRVYRLDVLGR